jgi:hypothetical protein
MSANNSTQREVIERLSVVLRPAKATVPAAPEDPREGAGLAYASVLGSDLLPGIRTGALQQRYRLYRVCGYGVVSAFYYAAKSPTW